jgi:hypothetical protein
MKASKKQNVGRFHRPRRVRFLIDPAKRTEWIKVHATVEPGDADKFMYKGKCQLAIQFGGKFTLTQAGRLKQFLCQSGKFRFRIERIAK